MGTGLQKLQHHIKKASATTEEVVVDNTAEERLSSVGHGELYDFL